MPNLRQPSRAMRARSGAAEDLVDQRELELARAENEFLAWEEVKADLGLA